MYILNTIAPLVILVAIGVCLRAFRFLPARFFKEANRLVFWVGLPCLLFHETAGASGVSFSAVRGFTVLAGGMGLCVVAGYLACWVLRVPRRSMGAFVQGAFRGNLAYLGLPLVLYALSGDHGGPPAEMAKLAVLVIAPLIPIYNFLAVFVLLAGQPHADARLAARLKRLGLNVATNPLIIACILGLAWSLTGRALPLLAARTCKALGQMALPVALISIGASLRLSAIKGNVLHACAAALIKVAVAPLAVFCLAKPLGLSGSALCVVMLYLACPTAIASYVMTEQMGGDDELAANIIVIGTLMALPAFALVLWATQTAVAS